MEKERRQTGSCDSKATPTAPHRRRRPNNAAVANTSPEQQHLRRVPDAQMQWQSLSRPDGREEAATDKERQRHTDQHGDRSLLTGINIPNRNLMAPERHSNEVFVYDPPLLPPRNSVYFCKECNRSFVRQDALQAHLDTSRAHERSRNHDEYDGAFGLQELSISDRTVPSGVLAAREEAYKSPDVKEQIAFQSSACSAHPIPHAVTAGILAWDANSHSAPTSYPSTIPTNTPTPSPSATVTHSVTHTPSTTFLHLSLSLPRTALGPIDLDVRNDPFAARATGTDVYKIRIDGTRDAATTTSQPQADLTAEAPTVARAARRKAPAAKRARRRALESAAAPAPSEAHTPAAGAARAPLPSRPSGRRRRSAGERTRREAGWRPELRRRPERHEQGGQGGQGGQKRRRSISTPPTGRRRRRRRRSRSRSPSRGDRPGRVPAGALQQIDTEAL
ncbi:hypothetical protein LTR16_001823 [Cryomyces antarcticus]|uniref:C2H2-type domain-containing protein n=1 Tax=Cryomyces antarcticus TaxID=329879 RepID=A0ABR0LZ93_9PEZI|nr:hypothetical protein LTR60_000999 [Cryomyces antarcticus]KAK5257022.1 hypothetical protein LTR16_001823 [Cryomyces antarcticus]